MPTPPNNVRNPLGSCGHTLSEHGYRGWGLVQDRLKSCMAFLSSTNGSTDFSPNIMYLSQNRFRAAAHRMPMAMWCLSAAKSYQNDANDTTHRSRSYEFLVKAPTETFKPMALLSSALAYDLYLILHLLPSGNFSFFANTQIMLATFVLICGGGSPPTSSCATLDMSLAAPTWSYEDLPGPWTMSSLVVLPASSLLIINGAAAGSAVNNGAANLVLTPYLIDTSLPVGHAGRFNELNSSSTARMFQATALLTPDATVIVHVRCIFSVTGTACQRPVTQRETVQLPLLLHASRPSQRVAFVGPAHIKLG
eukprot:SM000341S12984  [mRNA]  locus=s341:37140:38232:- [translate_table: standard]